MAEGTVQIAPDSTGKSVRTQEQTQLEPDGTLATVETQTVALVDALGTVSSLSELPDLLRELLDEVRVIRERLEFPED